MRARICTASLFVGMLLMVVGRLNAQSFGLPSGVEGLVKGVDFDIQGRCKCATIYFTTTIDPGVEQGTPVTIYLDNSAKWGDGKERDKVAVGAIVKLLDAIVHFRFPQYVHWQEVVTEKQARLPIPTDQMTIVDVADHAHSLYNCGLAQGMLDALRKTSPTVDVSEGQARMDKACENILGLLKQLDKKAAEYK
jgi:hypothetical protein